MHSIHFTIRQIADADLPTVRDLETDATRPANDAELLNLGIQHLHDDVYSCVEQYRRDDDTLEWEAHGHEHAGADEIPALSRDNPDFDMSAWIEEQSIAHGRDRYRTLPVGVRDKVLLARIIRSAIDGSTATELTTASLTAQEKALADNVGMVDGAPLVDLWTPDAGVAEAQRLAQLPDTGLERTSIPMVMVDETVDIIEENGLEPHRWAGERHR